jgi:hypothetical protein
MALETWAILEIMGHKRYAGHLREESVAGVAMFRLDIPEIRQLSPIGDGQGRVIPAWSKYFAAGAVYAITPVPEDVARRIALYESEEPVPGYQLETAAPLALTVRGEPAHEVLDEDDGDHDGPVDDDDDDDDRPMRGVAMAGERAVAAEVSASSDEDIPW